MIPAQPPAPGGSIRRRLTLLLLSGAVLLAGVLWLSVLGTARQVAQTSQDNVLLASATSILDSATVQAGTVMVDIPYSALSMLGNISEDRVFYRVTVDGAVLTGYAELPLPSGPVDARGRQFQSDTYSGEPVRMVTTTRQVSIDGEPVALTASVAQTLQGQATSIAVISRDAALTGLGFFAAAAALALWTARATVRPLNQLAASVSRRGPEDLSPVAAPVPTEMAPLVRALNLFIARLRKTQAQSEDFIAEAAHRVRTPLATVRSQAELTLHRVTRAENRAALRDMIEAIDESSRAAGQILDHAMVALRRDQVAQEPLDLAEAVADSAARLAPVAGLRDIALTVEAPGPALMPGDPILVRNAISNILDNAVKYAPAESDVQILLERDGPFWCVRVLDEGAGFTDSDPDQLRRRFARGGNTRGIVGSGLGLTIADEVVHAHRGRLDIHNRPEGGACVSLLFRAA